VFVLDDQEIVRRGVRGLLDAEPDIRVIGEAGTAATALTQIPALRPDVAVLDVRLPDGDGVSVCREVRSQIPGVACLMFTALGNPYGRDSLGQMRSESGSERVPATRLRKLAIVTEAA